MRKTTVKFEVAREFARKLKLKSYSQWRNYCKVGEKPLGIPCEPSSVYKNKGWISYSDWLGYYGPSKDIFNRKYSVNHDFFKVWSNDMAYVLGFWWADGNMPQNKKYFNILVQKRDECLLVDFLSALNSNYKINTRFNHGFEYSYISIYSPEINRDIERIGGCPNKTKVINFPFVPGEYISDFIRGYWDGDGTIIKNKNKKSFRSKVVSSSKDLIYGLKSALEKNINKFYAEIYVEKSKYYVLHLNGKNTKRLGMFMYANDKGIRLKRKMELFSCHIKDYVEQRGIETKFVTFEDAKIFSKKQKLFNRNQWYDLCSLSSFPLHIPKSPNVVYKKEWKGWKDFLGTDLI